jgi:CHASE2 domain-containing sensor protein
MSLFWGTNRMDVNSKLSFFAKLYHVDTNPNQGMWLLYITIIILSIIVYKLGFAKKLPVMKSAVVYILLALGCSIFTFLGVFLPVAEVLLISVVVLGIYKIRLYQSKKNKQEVA